MDLQLFLNLMIYHLLHLVRLCEYLNLDPILKVSDNMDSKFGLMLTTIL
jgi:hypothetical protein